MGAHTSKCAQWKQDETGIERSRSLGTLRQRGQSGYLDRKNVDKGRGGENNGGRRVAEAIAKRHKLRV